MKFKIVLILLLSVNLINGFHQGLFSQKIYETRNGCAISPHGLFRILNIYVNIIYDQTPERDPYYGKKTPYWQPGSPDRLNDKLPAYLDRFLDTDFKGTAPKGLMTRLFYESSLGNLILLGDFCVVNVRQSDITKDKPGKDFGTTELIKTAIETINRLGGIKTVYHHNSISDFDFFERGQPGVAKNFKSNGKIDLILYSIRNSYRKEQNGKELYNYGQVNPGEGYSLESNVCNKCPILMGDKYYEVEMSTIQGVGDADDGMVYKNIAFHEFSHYLFGSNAFHTSGGNHFGTINGAVFIGMQGGYGTMGGYNSSLVCCNGYERWRMGWIDTVNNPGRYAIAANGENADITRDDGATTFILRDFISTGDALRIKFPYVDDGASRQYLWLENHQVGKNGKIDFLHYSDADACRDKGSAGIYAFVQVGKDMLKSKDLGDLYPPDETDNLRCLTAKGNWDMRLEKFGDTIKCISWGSVKTAESYWLPNPLNGYNDLQMHVYDTSGKARVLSARSYCDYPFDVYRNGVHDSNLPYMGDNNMAFTGKAKMDIGSNPPAANVITFYATQYSQNFKASKTRINTRKIYLTGLSIEMEDRKDGTIKVDVRWDQYHIKNDVRWTGNILLKEQLFLDNKNTMLLDQDYTPNQLKRDSISGVFAAPTVLTCEAGSVFETADRSKVILDHFSSMIIRRDATFRAGKKCRIIIRNKSSVTIEKGANYDNKGVKIILRKGGTFKDENRQ